MTTDVMKTAGLVTGCKAGVEFKYMDQVCWKSRNQNKQK